MKKLQHQKINDNCWVCWLLLLEVQGQVQETSNKRTFHNIFPSLIQMLFCFIFGLVYVECSLYSNLSTTMIPQKNWAACSFSLCGLSSFSFHVKLFFPVECRNLKRMVLSLGCLRILLTNNLLPLGFNEYFHIF